MGKHIVFISGDEEYRSEEGLPMLAKILSQRHGFKCTVLFALDPDGTINPDNQKSLPGAEQLDSADAIVILTRFRQWPEEQLKHFVDAVNRGVTIVGLRTATHAPLRLIGISARSAGNEDALCRAAGMDGFVRKPVSGEMLADCLRRGASGTLTGATVT